MTPNDIATSTSNKVVCAFLGNDLMGIFKSLKAAKKWVASESSMTPGERASIYYQVWTVIE